MIEEYKCLVYNAAVHTRIDHTLFCTQYFHIEYQTRNLGEFDLELEEDNHFHPYLYVNIHSFFHVLEVSLQSLCTIIFFDISY